MVYNYFHKNIITLKIVFIFKYFNNHDVRKSTIINLFFQGKKKKKEEVARCSLYFQEDVAPFMSEYTNGFP